MTQIFVAGQTVKARGRDWTVVCPPEGDVDMLIADPHLTDTERAEIARTDRIIKAGKSCRPPEVGAGPRASLDLSEVRPA